MSDAVDHPDHYNANPSGVECIDVVEHMPFNVGNAVKYLWRAGHKGKLIEDLRKAAWYIAREIERLEKARPMDTPQPTLEDEWRKQCRIHGWNHLTPMPPAWTGPAT